MTVDVLAYLAGAVALVATAARIWASRGTARPSEVWTFCLGGGLVALVALLFAPATSGVLGRLETATGFDGAKVVGDALRMAGAGAAGLLAAQIRDDRAPSTRTLLWLMAGVEVVLVVSFVAGDFHVIDHGRFVVASRGAGVVYDLVRLLYPVFSLSLFLVAMWPYARDLPRGSVRTGSRLLALAAVIGIAWTSWTLDDIYTMATLGRQDIGDDLPSVLLEIAFVVTSAAAMTVTLWQRLARRGAEWWRAVRSYRAMAPLWQALCVPTGSSARRPATGLAERLAVSPWRASIARYRRVIEIRDAQLALRPYQLGLEDLERSARVEAGQIVAGLHAFTAGVTAVVDGPVDPSYVTADAASMRHGIEAEADWLAQVSRELVLLRSLPTD